MNTVPPKLIDQWIAFENVRADPPSQKDSPEAAHKKLQGVIGG